MTNRDGTSSDAGPSGQNSIQQSWQKWGQDLDNALSRTSSDDSAYTGHTGDRYVTGDVNWDNYELQALINMVGPPADPNQVDQVAQGWRTNGAQITTSATDLATSLTTLLNYWQGSAADQASAAVTNTANWVTAVGGTAGKMADSVEQAGGALRSAQATMPALAAAAAAAAAIPPVVTSGGAVGTATGTLMTNLASSFDASAQNTAMKQQAVQTMQRYEQAATTIDTTTPQFEAPVVWTLDTSTTTGTSGTGGAGIGAMPMLTSQVSIGDPTAGQNLGQTTVPSFADNPSGRWDALTAGGKVGGLGGTGGGGLGGGGALGGLGLFGAGGADSADALGRGKATAGSSAGAGSSSGAITGDTGGTTAGQGSAVGSSIMEDVGGRGAAVAGAPGAPGMAAPGARGGTGSEGEHRRRIPFEDEPFTTGLKAVPPVIGLNAVD